MKKSIFIYSFILFGLISCSKEWSVADQEMYMNDCLQFSEDQKEICECGLKKAMENYSSMEEAEEAIKNMSEQEVENFFAECM